MEKKMSTKSKVALALTTLLICVAAFVGLNYTLNTASSEPFYVDDSEPSVTYPVVTDYLMANIDPAITGSTPSSLSIVDDGNAFYYGYLVVDKSAVDKDVTIDGLYDSFESSAAILNNYRGISPLYDMGADSDYYIALVDDSIVGNKNLERYADVTFTEYDTTGTAVEGLIYDENTGITYIPKSLYEDENGNAKIHAMQQQLILGIDLENLSTDVYVTTHNESAGVTAVAKNQIVSQENMLDIETHIPLVTPETAQNIDISKLEIVINGLPVDATNDVVASIDEDGELCIGISPMFVSTVDVSFGTQDFFKMNKAQAMKYSDMKFCEANEIMLSGNVGVGSAHDYDAGAVSNVGGHFSNYDKMYFYYGQDHGDLRDHDGILDDIRYGGNSYESQICSAMTYAKERWANEESDYTPYISEFNQPQNWNGVSGFSKTKRQAWCSHYSKPLFDSRGMVRARILAVNRTAKQPYVIVGYMMYEKNSQSGCGIYKYKLKTKVEVAVSKTSAPPINKGSSKASATNPSNHYSLKGAGYKAYNTRAEAEARAEKGLGYIETDANGNGTSLINMPNNGEGKIYMVEVLAPDNYYLSDEIQEAQITPTTSHIDFKFVEEPKKATITYVVDGEKIDVTDVMYFGEYTHNPKADAVGDKGLYGFTGRNKEWFTDINGTQLWVDDTYVGGDLVLYGFNTVRVDFYSDTPYEPEVKYSANYFGDIAQTRGMLYGRSFNASEANNKFMAEAAEVCNRGFGSAVSQDLLARWYTEPAYQNKYSTANLTDNLDLYSYNNIVVNFYADYGPTWNYANIGLGDAASKDPRSYTITSVKNHEAPTSEDVAKAVGTCTRDYCETFYHWYTNYDGAFGYSGEISDSAITGVEHTGNVDYYGYNELKVVFDYTGVAKNLIAKYGFKESDLDLNADENMRYLYQYKDVTYNVDPLTLLPDPKYYKYGQVFDVEPNPDTVYYVDSSVLRPYNKNSWLNKEADGINLLGQQLTGNCTAWMTLDKFGYDGVEYSN